MAGIMLRTVSVDKTVRNMSADGSGVRGVGVLQIV